MAKTHPLDDRGCRLLSSRQWKQLRERVFIRPEATAEQLLEHYSQRPVKYRTGKLAFSPTLAEWTDAIRRVSEIPRRFV